MQFPHIRGLDLSLVEPLYALLDERHVTRAANRCGMSQSAMSRALDRLRSALDDELLVRAGGAYERTPRGDRLLVDLQDLLPRLEAAVRGDRFDPATGAERFRIATTDYAAAVVIPKLLARIVKPAPKVRIDVAAWNERIFGEMEAGRIHVALIGAIPSHPFESEPLFSDEFVCVVAENHPARAARMTLERYVACEHAVVAVGAGGGQPLIDEALAKRGLERRVGFRSAYQISAMLAVAHGGMICTTARRLAERLAPVAGVRIVEAPRELPEIAYRMSWHGRLANDAAQAWLRTQIRASATEAAGDAVSSGARRPPRRGPSRSYSP